MITDEAYRNHGLASACFSYAKELAMKENCYKMMLLTGSKKESTLRFYEQAGYNSQNKTAFIQWIKMVKLFITALKVKNMNKKSGNQNLK